MNTKDLVLAIQSGKSTDIQNSFDSVISDKLSEAIAEIRENILSDEEFEIVDFSLDESAGNLSGLSKHLMKTITNNMMAGENSKVVSSGPIKNASNMKQHIHQALENGHVPVVHVDGKPVKAVVPSSTYGARPEYRLHDTDGEKPAKEYHAGRTFRAGGRVHHSGSYEYTNPRPTYGKGDAINKMIHAATGGDKDAFKNKNIEVKAVAVDRERVKKHNQRVKNRPEMQSNYVNAVPSDDKKKLTYSGDKKETSRTPAGDGLKGIKDAAAIRLAKKKLGDKPNAEAEKLHAEIGKHIASGNYKEAHKAIRSLQGHIEAHGLETSQDKINDYAKNLKDLKGTYGRDYAKKNLERLRNESEEYDDDIIEALDSLIEQIENYKVEIPGNKGKTHKVRVSYADPSGMGRASATYKVQARNAEHAKHHLERYLGKSGKKKKDLQIHSVTTIDEDKE